MATASQTRLKTKESFILYFRIIRSVFYIVIITALCFIPLSFIENRSFCIFYNLFSIKCPGCGLTRAFFNIVHLNIHKAFEYNILIIVLFPMIVFLAGYDIFWIFTHRKPLNFIEKLLFNRLCRRKI